MSNFALDAAEDVIAGLEADKEALGKRIAQLEADNAKLKGIEVGLRHRVGDLEKSRDCMADICDALRDENAELIAAQPVCVGYGSEKLAKHLRNGTNVCDTTILTAKGDHCCVPIYLDPAPAPVEGE